MHGTDLTGIDFIDFGASAGGSLRWAQKTFDKVGLGIDLDPLKIQKTIEAGFRAVQADATNIELPDGAVEFSVISDFIEHLGTVDNARKVIESAIRVSRDFVYIAYPDFDNENQLKDLGLKRYYADWSGHNLHLKSLTLAGMVSKLTDGEYQVLKLGEIFDSYDRAVIPASAPRNSTFYDPKLYGEKPFVVFDRKLLFTRIMCIILKSNRYSMNDLLCKILLSNGFVRPVRTIARS